jgi:putative methionine-R-sulfoxide reductase with GAF domain
MCGRSLLAGASIVLADVAGLADGGYIACDPRDVSEVVVPLIGEDGVVWGVLDADSFARGAFDEDDARAIETLARGLGLIAGGVPPLPLMRL